MKQKTPSKFYRWIDKQTPIKVARKLGIDVSTVRYWRRGKTFPRVPEMQRIKRWTKGQISYSNIIDRK